jgi:hypothetical protein
MRVKTFTGIDPKAVDQEVNDWLAECKVKVRKTSSAFKHLRDKGPDAITGKTTTRRGVGVAISVWYDEPEPSKRVRSRPTNWTFRMIKKGNI